MCRKYYVFSLQGMPIRCVIISQLVNSC